MRQYLWPDTYLSPLWISLRTDYSSGRQSTFFIGVAVRSLDVRDILGKLNFPSSDGIFILPLYYLRRGSPVTACCCYSAKHGPLGNYCYLIGTTVVFPGRQTVIAAVVVAFSLDVYDIRGVLNIDPTIEDAPGHSAPANGESSGGSGHDASCLARVPAGTVFGFRPGHSGS